MGETVMTIAETILAYPLEIRESKTWEGAWLNTLSSSLPI